MGIKYLLKFLYAKNAIDTTTFASFVNEIKNNKRNEKISKPILCAVDIMKFVHDAVNSKEDPLLYLWDNIQYIISFGIIPIICFDGKPDQDRRDELSERRNKRYVEINSKIYESTINNINNQFNTNIQSNQFNQSVTTNLNSDNKEDNANNFNSIQKGNDDNLHLNLNNNQEILIVNAKEQTNYIKENNINIKQYKFMPNAENIHILVEKFKSLCNICNLPVLYQDYIEADFWCSKLVNSEIASFAVSGDTDLLLYGCNKVINFKSKDSIIVFDKLKILNKLKFNYNDYGKFVCMCLMMGGIKTVPVPNLQAYDIYLYFKNPKCVTFLDYLELSNNMSFNNKKYLDEYQKKYYSYVFDSNSPKYEKIEIKNVITSILLDTYKFINLFSNQRYRNNNSNNMYNILKYFFDNNKINYTISNSNLSDQIAKMENSTRQYVEYNNKVIHEGNKVIVNTTENPLDITETSVIYENIDKNNLLNNFNNIMSKIEE